MSEFWYGFLAGVNAMALVVLLRAMRRGDIKLSDWDQVEK